MKHLKYLIFTDKPIGKPKISKNNYISPTQCVEGWFVDIQFKGICDSYKWDNYTEASEITPNRSGY